MLEMSPSNAFSRAARAVVEKYYDVAENSTFSQGRGRKKFPATRTKN